jgi:hypothetical protein
MKGSRLRLVVAEETAKDTQVSRAGIYHDSEYPSTIQLPLR